MTQYAYNYDILCAACNKPRYFGYTDLPDNKMCICAGQDKIPSYDRRLELTDEALLYASPEDWAFYNEKILPGLPTMAGASGDGKDKFGEYIPYHSGPHILRHFRDTIEIVKPRRILEIGFNMGHSAAMWLNLCDAYVYSVDISLKDETFEGGEYLYNNFHDRFEYRITPSGDHYNRLRWATPFDLCFIDGAHDEHSIIKDTAMCMHLKIPFILYDDYYEKFGETKKALRHFRELELVKDMNNLRLYKVNYDN